MNKNKIFKKHKYLNIIKINLCYNSKFKFNEIFEVLNSHNFDLFSEKTVKEMTSKQRRMKKTIEAFEYQHQEDFLTKKSLI